MGGDTGAHGPRISAVCTVESLFRVPSNGIASGINKVARDEPIRLLTHGVLGDVQGDREHHGGLFKAVYAFAAETRGRYAEEDGREDFAPGFFGENLVTEGFDLDEIVIGTRIHVGSAVLEASVPRTPCSTFNAWVGERTWSRRFTERGVCGSYFRVITEGEVAAGDVITVLSVPNHGVTMGHFFRSLTGALEPEKASALLDWAEDRQEPLYRSMAGTCLAALAAAGAPRGFPAHLMSDGRGN